MAEVPQHLLDKAKARRAALAGQPAPVADAATTSTEVAVSAATATPATPVAAGGGGSTGAIGSAYPAIPASPLAPKGMRFAKMGSVFLLTVTPIWALFMFSAWATPHVKGDTPPKVGAAIFSNGCASCHQANGSGWDTGGIGRALWNNEAEKTFPDPIQQAAFVWRGSCEQGTPYGDPKREGGAHIAQQKGVMPAFGTTLSPAQVFYAITYERAVLSGKDWPTDPFAKVGENDDPVRAAKPIDEAALRKQIEDAAKTICG